MFQRVVVPYRLRRLDCLRRIVPTPYSTVDGHWYHSKVAALPFALNLKEAALKTASLVFGLYASSVPIHSDLLRPVRAKAFYLPTWISDAEMVIEKVHFGSEVDGVAKHTESVAILNGQAMYYPGFSRFPLSFITFPSAGNMLNSETWNPSMTTLSDDSAVTCLPYTRTPFAIPAFGKSMTSTQAHYSDQLHFDPNSLKFPLIGPVYPILFPVILLSYTIPFPPPLPLSMPPGRPVVKKTITVVLEAQSRDGRTYVDDLGILGIEWETWLIKTPGSFDAKLLECLLRFLRKIVIARNNFQGEIPLAYPREGAFSPTLGVFGKPVEARLNLHGTLVCAPGKEGSIGSKGRLPPLEKLISAWSEKTMLAAELALSNSFTSPEQIDWEDPRIRPPTKEEIVSNSEYTKNRTDWRLRRSLASPEKTWISDPSQDLPDFSDADVEAQKAEMRMKESEPIWLQQDSKSSVQEEV